VHIRVITQLICSKTQLISKSCVQIPIYKNQKLDYIQKLGVKLEHDTNLDAEC